MPTDGIVAPPLGALSRQIKETIIMSCKKCTLAMTYKYTGATAGDSRVLACIRVLTRSRGWNMSVEATALRPPLEKATRTPWPLLSVIFLEDII